MGARQAYQAELIGRYQEHDRAMRRAITEAVEHLSAFVMQSNPMDDAPEQIDVIVKMLGTAKAHAVEGLVYESIINQSQSGAHDGA